ncbi:MAG: ABC transporter substrate-binding protein [Thermodesulfobacteriota bacterium]
MQKRGVILVIIATVIFSVALVSLPSYGGSSRGITDTTIKVGGIWDFTGPVSNIMTPVCDGTRTYIRHINDQGGINGRKIKYILEDDRYIIPAALAAFKKLVYRDEIFALLGPGSTGEAKTLMSKIMKEGLPTIPCAADKDLLDPYRRYIFGPIATYEHQTGVLLDWIVQKSKPRKPKIVCLVADVAAKAPFLDGIQKWAKFFDLDVPVVMTPVGNLDFTSEILIIKRENPDYVIPFLVIPAIGALIRDSKKLGLNCKVYATYSGTSEDVLNIAGKVADNFYGVHFFSSWYDDNPGMAELRKVTLHYHPGTEKPYRSKNFTIGWIIAKLFHEGLKRAGRDLDNEKLIDALETLRDFDTGGISGPITITPKSHEVVKYERIYNGDPATQKLIPISDWRDVPKIK